MLSILTSTKMITSTHSHSHSHTLGVIKHGRALIDSSVAIQLHRNLQRLSSLTLPLFCMSTQRVTRSVLILGNLWIYSNKNLVNVKMWHFVWIVANIASCVVGLSGCRAIFGHNAVQKMSECFRFFRDEGSIYTESKRENTPECCQVKLDAVVSF